MSENEPEKPKRGWGWLQLGVVLVVLSLIACYFISSSQVISVQAWQTQGCMKARQITGMLLTYASDHDGHYPDFGKDPSKLTSNEVFRDLVRVLAADGLTVDETTFSCPQSAFVGDKNLGQAPDFKEALRPGENHWMMIAGLRNDSRSPLLLENAVEAPWPPKWLPYAEPSNSSTSWFLGGKKSPPRGRSWQGNTIIISHNDTSADVVKLVKKDGLMHLPERYLKPNDETPSEFKILDIEVPSPK